MYSYQSLSSYYVPDTRLRASCQLPLVSQLLRNNVCNNSCFKGSEAQKGGVIYEPCDLGDGQTPPARPQSLHPLAPQALPCTHLCYFHFLVRALLVIGGGKVPQRPKRYLTHLAPRKADGHRPHVI